MTVFSTEHILSITRILHWVIFQLAIISHKLQKIGLYDEWQYSQLLILRTFKHIYSRIIFSSEKFTLTICTLFGGLLNNFAVLPSGYGNKISGKHFAILLVILIWMINIQTLKATTFTSFWMQCVLYTLL